MDISASGEEVPMDTSGANEASGGTENPIIGGESSSSPDFPWPFGFTKCGTGQLEESNQANVSYLKTS